MASSDGDSDIRLDRIQAREDHFRRDFQARGPSPATKKPVDPTELDCIGAHLHLSKHEPWENDLELTDNEATHNGTVSAPISIDTNMHARTDPDGSAADGSPTSRACTPTKCGTYLPAHEYGEFQRQRSVKNRRRISLSTTIEPGTQDGHEPSVGTEPHDPYSTSHTPPHRSQASTDRDNRSLKNMGPTSPRPWSQVERTVGRDSGGD